MKSKATKPNLQNIWSILTSCLWEIYLKPNATVIISLKLTSPCSVSLVSPCLFPNYTTSFCGATSPVFLPSSELLLGSMASPLPPSTTLLASHTPWLMTLLLGPSLSLRFDCSSTMHSIWSPRLLFPPCQCVSYH